MQKSMTNSSDREVAVFNAALNLAEQQRPGYLEQTCAGDDALRLRVEALLRLHAEAGTFLEAPVASAGAIGATAAEGGPSGTIRFALSSIEKTGDRIGRYKLLQQIGEGGCGVVYMAEQSEPVRRKVALKVIKLGMDTKNVIARFEAERQALALMDHPNIAKVLDAGATETGRPFFVMELVKGVRITDYCDQNNLATEARLKLFTQVCHAIQHAHQKGIIHRDIKPSNILVTMHDGVPVPKVIDFGIAKATTDQPLTDKTLFTAFEQFIGTPAYMSPEQAEMTGLDIDTRTDIYALGVLLYELLTGRTPFDPRALIASGLEAMRRTIREQEPDRPSTALSTMVAADLSDVAKHRQTEAPGLVHMLRGDLDWIVMKALEKDRTRRYETANGLAMDVQRHLANEPVVARPPNNLYRFQKLFRRNKVAFVATSAVAMAVLIGLGLSTWLLVKETAARRRAVAAEQAQERMRHEADSARAEEEKLRLRAETEAVKSQQVAQLLEDMLRGVGPSVALGRDTALLREILDKTARRVGVELKGQPGVEAELDYTLGEAYFELGEFATAEVMHRRALELRKGVLVEGDPLVALSTSHLGRVLLGRRKFNEAEGLLRQALAAQRKAPGQKQADTLFTLTELSVALNAEGGSDRRTEAEALVREVLATDRKLFGEDSLEAADTLHHLAAVLRLKRELADAETADREALAILRKSSKDELSLADSLAGLAGLLETRNKLEESEGFGREALEMKRKLYPKRHPALANSLFSLARVLQKRDKPNEAEPLFREAAAIWKTADGPGTVSAAMCLQSLGIVIFTQHKLAEAEPVFREEITMCQALGSQAELQLSAAYYWLGHVLYEQGKLKDAEASLREALTIRGRQTGKDALAPDSLYYLGVVLESEGKRTEAQAASREALSMSRRAVQLDPGRSSTRTDLGSLLWQVAERLAHSGKPEQAEQPLREALKVFGQAVLDFPGEGPYLSEKEAYGSLLLGRLLERNGQHLAAVAEYNRMIPVLQKAIATFPKEPTLKWRLTEALAAQEKIQALSEAAARNSPGVQ